MVFYHDPENDLYGAYEEFRLRQEIYDIGKDTAILNDLEAGRPVSDRVIPVPEPADLLALLKHGGDLVVAYKNLAERDDEDIRKQNEFWKAYKTVEDDVFRMVEAGQGWTLPSGEG